MSNTSSSIRDRVRNNAPLPWPLAALLEALTPATRFGMWYRRRLPVARVKAHVISFGNLTAGGTGKTPAVIERAQLEIAAGKRVAILTRGYGSRPSAHPEVVRVADLADEIGGLYERVGDEPALIARAVPEAYVIKHPARVVSARLAVDQLGCDTIILDDGFQHIQLARDEDIVVIDATNPFGNGKLLPRGILREPLGALTRATRFILTRCDQATESVAELEAELAALCPGIPVRKTCHRPIALWNVGTGAQLPLEALRGHAVDAVCAIGNPESFFMSLESLGAVLRTRRAYRDHAEIPVNALPETGFVVTTEKDAVRLTAPPPSVHALQIALTDI